MMDEKEIFERVKKSIVDALGADEEDVRPEALLFDDLGAESLDLLDIIFRLEKAFAIKLPRTSIQKEFLAAEGLKEEDVVVDGALTPLGAEKLREKMPEIGPERIHAGFYVDAIPTLFTVQTFITMVKRALAEKEMAGA